MNKKYILIPLMIATIMTMSACGNKDVSSNETAEVVTAETVPNLDTVNDTYSETTENKELEAIQTVGIYKSEEKAEDVNGEYSLYTFTDTNGNDFVATISKDTKIPDEMIEGNSYIVMHSKMMTRSLPGIYPEVYSIVEMTD